MRSGRLGLLGLVLVLGGTLLMGVGAALGGGGTDGWRTGGAPGTRGTGPGGMMGRGLGGMMGGASRGTARAWQGASGPGPGEAGFVVGTAAAPRVVRVLATANRRFLPDTVRVQAGETIQFEVTVMGPVAHEFMVGPAADVAANTPGTPEVTDIGMMRTGTLTYTFSGPGPFAFACHVTGHYEAGMTGTIVIVS